MLGLTVADVLLVAVWDSIDLAVVVCASPNAILDTIAGRREGTKVLGAAPGGTVTLAAVVVFAVVLVVVFIVVVVAVAPVVVGELVVLADPVCGQ